MCCSVGFNHWPKVVEPVQSWLVSFESSQKAVYWIGTLSDGFGQLWPDELGSVIDGKFVPVFILQEGKIFLDIVSEDEHVWVLASNGKQLLTIEIPYFIVEVLGDTEVTFMRRTE